MDTSPNCRWGYLIIYTLALSAWIFATPGAEAARDPVQILSSKTSFLRSGDRAEWQEFAQKTPDGDGLIVHFNAHTNLQEATLLVAQDNVKLDWGVVINQRKLGNLFLMEEKLVCALAIPAGTLKEGDNMLEIFAAKENDDIFVGPILLDTRTRTEVFHDSFLSVRVTDRGTGTGLPCRLTVVDDEGRLVPMMGDAAQRLAVRPGVAYTGNGEAHLGLRPGRYTVYATRGPEYGLGVQHLTVGKGQTMEVDLQIGREVDTPGTIASDTHVHTGEFAKHGDATVEERVLTLAGEGIEFPVSTEHDQLVDLREAALKMGVAGWMTPVIGDEVTTAKGHFNVFPVEPKAKVPDKKLGDWPQLMTAFRATPEVEIVVLNHPRNIHVGFQPFAATNFNAVTGDNLRGFPFTFDAIEVANSSALQSDWMISFQDWFALLNHGYHFTAVGSSDGHDVSRYIVGQGRTYITSRREAPNIDVDEVCRNLRAGHATVSLGLVVGLMVDGKFGPGDLAENLSDELRVRATVQGTTWSGADRIELFANGLRVRDERIVGPSPTEVDADGRRPSPFHFEVEWRLPRPRHDVHLIALASGPGIAKPYWAVARPYQPSSPVWEGKVFGATNPIWVDGDGDGQFTAARKYAEQMRKRWGNDFAGMVKEARQYDEAVAAQLASLCAQDGVNLDSRGVQEQVEWAGGVVRLGFQAFCRAYAAGRSAVK